MPHLQDQHHIRHFRPSCVPLFRRRLGQRVLLYDGFDVEHELRAKKQGLVHGSMHWLEGASAGCWLD